MAGYEEERKQVKILTENDFIYTYVALILLVTVET